ncbi:MAG: ABC transporter ATP-binding protein [Bacteroidetes bacterium]|uniref:ABC transporter ATP-binding protein n=1 Tax=Phaeocystidibacter marisrubri TaxID=1577780 RepID=A0A6L3ZGY5_9FLAO|nr:ABC transporter ATP-binding protein [Phaeocystidibacter marisrubri]KAB2816899.1 ABC transporter ATP-binding protein [Phaeocystidibacter marisrubri]TNE27512.1 MAG: ABC transporter ATP-binding protein [Bacteroidota bacterium]GGH77677.1 ABC transporter ATP-binding protein [Phaeocystidibacter marisrubri]
MIEISNLSKIYRSKAVETVALHKVSLTIERGEFVSIMGPSGCGKSTLLNILGMLDTPTNGHYSFDDKLVFDLKESERVALRKMNIGFVFQSFNLIDELTVAENVELPLVYLKRPKVERKKRVAEILERMGMMHRAQHFPGELSGGQQQRVAVARAVIADPKVILADEPTGNLDTVHGNEVMELLSELNERGTTIVMVTHSSHDASYSKRIVRLLDGEVVSENKLMHV